MKKNLSVLILSFLLFGSATINSKDRMELRSVLANDIVNTESGNTITPKRAGEAEIKEVANKVKIQQRHNDNGTYDVRFVAGISSIELSKAVFNVTIDTGSKSASKSYDVTRAYTHIIVNEDTLSATDVFGEGFDYLVAYAISGVPESAAEYTFNVNVSINDDNGVLDTSETRSIILKDIIEQDEVKLEDFSDSLVSNNGSLTTVNIDSEVSHDGVQSAKIKGVNYTQNKYTQARYNLSNPVIVDNLKISCYVKLDGNNIRSNRITFRVAPVSGNTVDPQIYLNDTSHPTGVTVEKADANGWYKIILDCNTLSYQDKTLAAGAKVQYVRFTIEPEDKNETTPVIEPIIWVDELNFYYEGENGEIIPAIPVEEEEEKIDLSDKITHSSNTTISTDTEVNHDGTQSTKITGKAATGREDYSLAFYNGNQTLTAETTISFYAKLGDNIYDSRIAFRIETEDGTKVNNNISIVKTNPVSGVTCTPDHDGWYLVEIDVATFTDYRNSSLSAVGGTLKYLRFGIICTDRENTTPSMIPVAWIDQLYIY